MKHKRLIDFLLLMLLLLLMTYEHIGQATHEYLGIAMAVLLMMHHLCNRPWHKHLFRGTYTRRRAVMTALNVLLLILLLMQVGSGILMARHTFAFLPRMGGRSAARTIHMTCAYWSFALMCIHTGMHLLPAIRRWQQHPAGRVLAGLCLPVALYGLYALFHRQLPGYMLMQVQFAFFDFSEPVLLFLLDYLTIMLLFTGIGIGVQQLLGQRQASTTRKERKG